MTFSAFDISMPIIDIFFSLLLIDIFATLIISLRPSYLLSGARRADARPPFRATCDALLLCRRCASLAI